MNAWACPNTLCVYDKMLQVRQRCPVCGEEAREFKFSELDVLWKKKWTYEKSLDEAKNREKVLASVKFCPKCGSANINVLAFYPPSTWKCLDCGYEGAFILEDSNLAERYVSVIKKGRRDKFVAFECCGSAGRKTSKEEGEHHLAPSSTSFCLEVVVRAACTLTTTSWRLRNV